MRFSYRELVQLLGNRKRLLKQISNYLEAGKSPQNEFPTTWKPEKALKTDVQLLGSRLNAQNRTIKNVLHTHTRVRDKAIGL